MPDADTEYSKLVKLLADGDEVTAGQMFGKPCLKVNGKAFDRARPENQPDAE